MTAFAPIAEREIREPAGAAPAWRPEPYVLLRLAGKPYRTIGDLALPRTVARIERLLELRAWLAANRDPACDALYEAIGAQSGPLRGRLVALKRALFNGRRPGRAERALLRQSAPSARRPVLQYAWNLRRLERQTRAARTCFEAELTERRRALQSAFGDSEFQKAVQAVSPSLAAGLQRYMRADPADLRMRERKAETGGYHYLMRMAAKTSPFGRFGPVARATFDPDCPRALSLQARAPRLVAASSFNLNVAAALTASLGRAPELQPLLRLRVNQSYYVAGETIAFTRPKAVADQAVYTQLNTLCQGPCTPAMRAILSFIEARGDDLPTFAEVVAHLCALAPRPGMRERAEALLEKLIGAGLVLRDIRLPSNTLDRLGDLRGWLAARGAADLAEQIGALDARARRFADAAPAERDQILADLRARSDALLRWHPPVARAQAERADLLVEDTALAGCTLRLGPAFFAPFLDDIGGWLECVARRDQGGLNAAWLRDIFTATYGEGGACANLLQFASVYRRELNGLLGGQGGIHGGGAIAYPRGNQINAQMLRYLETLGTLAQQHADAPECAVPPATLQALSDSFADLPEPWCSAAMHLQVAAESWEAVERGDYLVVLNYTLPGFGHFFTRYCYLFDQQPAADEPTLAAQIRASLEQLQAELPAGQQLAELLSVLDHNAQVHPCFTAQQIVPPEETSELAPERRIPVQELELLHDPAADRLRVVRRRADGTAEAIVPLYMGFFHLMALPALHRLLVELSPSGYHMERIRPHEHQESMLLAREAAEARALRHYPRLRIGRFVLQRELWAVPPELVPGRDAEDEFSRFLEIYAWARGLGLPREVFVRLKRDPRRPMGDFHTDHKPIHLDFANFFSIKTFLHLLDDPHIQALQIEEMLPAPSQLFFELAGERYPVEFQVEFRRGGPNHG